MADGGPMFGVSRLYSRRCARCSVIVKPGGLMVWFKRTGWICARCWSEDPGLHSSFHRGFRKGKNGSG